VIRRTASRFGLLADVHANLQALEAALAHLEAEGVEEIWCLGDVVGYGGDPAACVELVRERCAGTVRGNHDAAAVDPRLRDGFNPHARAAIERQAELLDADTLEWLGGLPPTIELDDVLLLHGSVADPDGFTYVMGSSDADRELDALVARWGFYAHTHVPAGWRKPPEGGAPQRVQIPASGEVRLEAPGRYLVNPGAVGQPRDGDPRAACAVFERAGARLRIARLPYDVAAAQAAIRRAGMPAFEADRLEHGR
jgi:diadenosine tetraphosphatase ApaH/serine/threonine PP2A family protein phosphatase